MKRVTEEITRLEFKNIMLDELLDIHNHAAHMKKQYLQIQNLKQNLKKGSCNSPKGLCQTMNEI